MKNHNMRLRKIQDFINVYWGTVILYGVFIAGIFFTWLYLKNPSTPGPILSGLLTGCVLLFVQLLFDLQKSKELSKLKEMRIQSIIPYREGKGFYSQLIKNTTESISIAGTTISRFLNDFAHPQRADSQSLLHALDLGVDIRFLIPTDDFLSHKDILRAQETIKRINEINAENRAGKIQIKKFKHAPAHSLFVADEECLIGPVFPDVSSNDSPAIHTVKKSKFASPYLNYFEKEWNNATPV